MEDKRDFFLQEDEAGWTGWWDHGCWWGGFHLEPSSEEGNHKKLNIWGWSESPLGGVVVEGERER